MKRMMLLPPVYLAINGLLAAHLWLGAGVPARVILPVVETVVVFILVGLSLALRHRERTRRGGARRESARRISWYHRGSTWLGVTAVLVLATGIVFSTAETLVQYIWGRSFVFRSDVLMVRSVLFLVFGDIGDAVDVLLPITVVLLAAVAVAAAVGAVLAIRWTVTPVCRLYQTGPVLPTVLVLGAVLGVGVSYAAPAVNGYPRGAIAPVIVRSVAASGRLELRTLEGRPAFETEGEEGRETNGAGVERSEHDDEPGHYREADAVGAYYHGTDRIGGEIEAVRAEPDYVFPGIRDRDIHFFMIEAYGYNVFSREDLREELSPELDRLAHVLAEAGYGVVSDYLAAPVFGGFSWLSETTVLTGQPVDTQPKFAELLELSAEQEIPSLTRMLHDGGYYTLAVKPGTVHGSWPEGWDLFRFERSLVAYDGDFDYHGPWFSYVAVTDQHAIWTTHNHLKEVRSSGGPAEGRPVYVHYQLTSSHTPFNRIPPYIENWEDLGDGTIYNERSHEIQTFDNTWGGGSELDEGFVAAIGYTLRVLAQYIDQHLDHDRRPILIFMGDHQPQRPIREHDAGPSVPVHIASRDEGVLEALRAEGYEWGLYGTQPPPHDPMMDFFPMLRRIAVKGPYRGSR